MGTVRRSYGVCAILYFSRAGGTGPLVEEKIFFSALLFLHAHVAFLASSGIGDFEGSQTVENVVSVYSKCRKNALYLYKTPFFHSHQICFADHQKFYLSESSHRRGHMKRKI